MFKNLIVYRIARSWMPDLVAAEQALSAQRFAPCTASQAVSRGWVEPRGIAHGSLIEAIGRQWMLTLKTEAKLLPAAVVKRRVTEMARAIERETGRRPGQKSRKELTVQATLELLPQAFTRETTMRVWIDSQAHLLAIDSSSAKAADEAVTRLATALPNFAVLPVLTRVTPEAALSNWLLGGELPGDFSINQSCELKDAATKAGIRYAGLDLEAEEVKEHIRSGKKPTKLALSWRGRLHFVMTHALTFKRLEFDDVVFAAKGLVPAEEHFDADVAIATGEMKAWLPAMFDALGGLVEES